MKQWHVNIHMCVYFRRGKDKVRGGSILQLDAQGSGFPFHVMLIFMLFLLL
jgi:hypothetical protein